MLHCLLAICRQPAGIRCASHKICPHENLSSCRSVLWPYCALLLCSFYVRSSQWCCPLTPVLPHYTSHCRLPLCPLPQVKDELRPAVYHAVVALLGDADIVVQVRPPPPVVPPSEDNHNSCTRIRCLIGGGMQEWEESLVGGACSH